MALDKWQIRQAQEHAATNGVTYEEAVAELFDPEGLRAEPAAEEKAPAESTKVKVTK